MDPHRCFILPGLNNSGDAHWQTHWQNDFGYLRIEQDDWDNPVSQQWIERIQAFLAPYPPQEIILIGHSLACCAIVQWAAKYQVVIKGALLVAPSDTEAPSYPPGTTGFTPMPLQRLRFPSIVVASADDPYVSLECAKQFADVWGSEFDNAGDLGHINASSGIGKWPQGITILQKLFNASIC